MENCNIFTPMHIIRHLDRGLDCLKKIDKPWGGLVSETRLEIEKAISDLERLEACAISIKEKINFTYD